MGALSLLEFLIYLACWNSLLHSSIMALTGEGCSDHFTRQQVARMHCYADLVYQAWQDVKIPSPIPLPPQVDYTFKDL